MIELLKADCQTNLSNADIALHINSVTGSDLTRNAVIGKRRRLGLDGTRNSGKPSAKPGPKKKGPHTSVARITINQTSKPLPREKLPPKPEANVTLVHLMDGMCKWPVGELYCGMITENARTSYCEFHRDAARKQASGNPAPARPFFQYRRR